MNGEQLRELLRETKDAIKKSLDGSESREETIGRYKRIHEKYTIAARSIAANKDASIIRGILLNNNSENFAKLTALYSSEGGDFTLFDHSGDKNLLDGLKDILKKEIDLESGKEYYEVKISEKENLLYMLYCSLQKNGKQTVLLSSISSSHYFEKNRFLYLSGIIGKLFSLNSLLNRSSAIDVFSDMLDGIDRTIRESIDSGTEMLGHFYIFKSIEDIFKNSSFSTYSNITDVIINQLKSHHGDESKIFILSLKKFLVLETIRKDHEESNNLKGKVNIIYNELPLPYETVILDLSDYTSIQDMWGKMTLFAKHVLDGDIS
jgi:hypothetical protein